RADQLKGLTVLGKIELPVESRRKGSKPVASSDEKKGKKKKRKRIIVGTEGSQQPGQAQSQPGQGNQRPIVPSQHRAAGAGNQQRPPRPGGGPGGKGAPRHAPGARPEKAEVT